MKALSVDRIRYLREELSALNKGTTDLSAFDRDVEQALKELFDIKSDNKTKRKKTTVPNPWWSKALGEVTPRRIPATATTSSQSSQKVSLRSNTTLYSVDCPRCGTTLSDAFAFTKRACPSCAAEKITILLSSQ